MVAGALPLLYGFAEDIVRGATYTPPAPREPAAPASGRRRNRLTESVGYTSADPTYFFLPGFLLVLIVVMFNLVGDGARDALDPKSSR